MTKLRHLCIGLGVLGALAFAATAEEPNSPQSAGDKPRAIIKVSQDGAPLGEIVVELAPDRAPISTYNFVKYAEDGYYDQTIFHRVIKGFMIQGGGFTAEMDKKTEGLRGGIVNEWKNGLKNKRGTISMARLGGQPNSATSQFFINHADNASLDRPQRDGAAYAVFGKVVAGLDVVDKIAETPVHRHPKYPGGNSPEKTVVIDSVKIVGEYDKDALAAKFKELNISADEMLARSIKQWEAEAGGEFQATDSGLRYLVLKEPTGEESPEATDTVRVHYTGWLADGTKFDSSVDRGEPARFPLNRVIAGWTEGVGMMKVGEKRKLIIPFELGYGMSGHPPTIPPKATLVFDVELLEIE